MIAAFDFRFMGGSMGRAVGDGLLRAAEEAVARKAALLVVPASGGARMQEGIYSLMQMPRSIIAVDRMRQAGLPYIVLLAHPTTGGVTAFLPCWATFSWQNRGDYRLCRSPGNRRNSARKAAR